MPAPAPKFHPASLVPSSNHSSDVLQIVQEPVTKPLLDYLVDTVADTVDYAMGRSATSSPSSSKSSGSRSRSQFPTFVNTVLTRAEVTTPVILTSLVYISRARPHLHIALEEWALERVFLGALIVASKYLNDSTLKNVHWALCTGVFGKRDVGRIEREFLDVLDFELSIREEEILGQREILREYKARAGNSITVVPEQRIPESLSSPRKAPAPPTSSRNHRRSHQSHSYLPIPQARREASYSPSSSSDSSSEGSVSPQTPSSSESSPARGRPQKASRYVARPYSKPIQLQLPGLGTHDFPIRLDVDADGDIQMS